MLSHEVEEMLIDRLVERVENANTYILEQIGKNIKQILSLKPSDAYRLQRMLKYGGDFNKILKKLADITGMNVKEIYSIFEATAKEDQLFAKQFYEYRKMQFIPYAENIELQRQVRALGTITAMQYINISNTTTIGYVFTDLNGKKTFKNIQQTYYDLIDEAILNVTQGKANLNSAMRRTLKQLGGSGLVVYDSGRTRRLDSAIRQNILGGIKDLSTELSMQFGEEYGADGVEISAHSNSAPDHEDVQGRQFTLEEYDNLQATGYGKDVNGKVYTLWLNSNSFRPIEEYNCYHMPLNIIVGVSKPEYTEEQLQQMKEDNKKGFKYEGKHYTMYEGTQLQRKIETAIRQQKDTYVLAKASGDKELMLDCQKRVNQLTSKYNDVCNISGLLPKKNRLSVSGYRGKKR